MNRRLLNAHQTGAHVTQEVETCTRSWGEEEAKENTHVHTVSLLHGCAQTHTRSQQELQ